MIIQKKLDLSLDGINIEGDVWEDIPLPLEYTDPIIFLDNHPDKQLDDEYRIIYDDGRVVYAESFVQTPVVIGVAICKSK